MKFERPEKNEYASDPHNQAMTVTIVARVTPFQHDEVASTSAVLKAINTAIDAADVVTGLIEFGEPEVYYNFDVVSIENTVDTEAQIKHIEEHAQEFEDYMGTKTDVRGYFAQYAHVNGLYEQLCRNLEIEPR